MNRTIYIPDQFAETWDKLEKDAADGNRGMGYAICEMLEKYYKMLEEK